MNNREIHYRYAISYLFVAIISLLALAYYNVPNLVDKLSFALTLSSLLLAVLAIFYTIISSTKQDHQFLKLNETQSELKTSAIEIKNVSKNLNKFFSDVPQHFEKLDVKIDSLADMYTSPPPDPSSSDAIDESIEITEIKIDNFLLSKMIMKLQYPAMGVLYLFTQSYLKGENIEFSIFEELNIHSYEYGIGVLNGLQTTSLVGFKIHQDSIIPTRCNRLLCDELKNNLVGIQKVIDDKNRLALKNMIQSIDDRFA